MKIKDIVSSNLITSDINNNIKEICNLMYKHNIGIIPITDNNIIIGLLTDRDIVIRGIDKNLKDIITYNIISIDVNDTIENALKLLKTNKIKRLLVTSNNNYIGIISISDIIKSDYNPKEIFDVVKEIYSQTLDLHNVEVDTFYL